MGCTTDDAALSWVAPPGCIPCVADAIVPPRNIGATVLLECGSLPAAGCTFCIPAAGCELCIPGETMVLLASLEGVGAFSCCEDSGAL